MWSFPRTTIALVFYLLAPVLLWAQPEPPLTLQEYGTAASSNERQLRVRPATLSFGNVTVGKTGSRRATLTALNRAVRISSDQSSSSEFCITGLALPIRIPAGKSIEVTIQFTPNASGKAVAQAEFISNAKDSPTIEQLKGTGVAQGSHQVDLSWDAGGGDMVGYNIFRGNTHGGPYEQINSALDSSTDYTDYNVVGGKTYYYVTTEVNTQGEQSGYSNEAEVKVPTD